MMKSIVIIVACLFMTLIHQYFKPSWCPHWFWGQFFGGDINSLLVHRWWMFQANRVRLAGPCHSALELFQLGEAEMMKLESWELRGEKFHTDIMDQVWPSCENWIVNKGREASYREISWINFGQVVKRELWIRREKCLGDIMDQLNQFDTKPDFNILIVTWTQYSVYIYTQCEPRRKLTDIWNIK